MARLQFFDGLRNLVSGLGGQNDKAQGSTYVMKMPTRQEIDACYRSTWLGRKIHDIPALDMTREWRAWQADDNQIEAIELTEKNLQVRARVRRALVLSRLYGGSAIIMGLPGDPKTPAPETIAKGQLKYLHVVHRHQLSLAEQVRDLADPLFGRPSMLSLNNGVDGTSGAVDIHPSRVVSFTGNALPDGAMGAIGEDWYWGDPVLVSVFDALTAHDTGTAAIANLLNEAKMDIVHIPGFMDNLTSTEYERTLMERINLAALIKGITNTLILDGGDGTENSGERWEQKTINWTGLPDIQRTLFQLVSGAADIPATRLIGMSPQGMNATGESDTRNYYDMLSSLQNSDLAPTMSPLDEYLIMNAVGSRPPEIYYEWNPLWQMSPKEKADRDKIVAEMANTYVNMGAIPDDALAVAIQNRLIEDHVFPGLEAAIEEAEKVSRLESDEPEPGAVDPVTGEPIVPPGGAGIPAPANQNDPANKAKAPAGKRPGIGSGRGSAVTSMSGNSKRRASNDRARARIRDMALPMDDALLLTELADYNKNHVRTGANGGEFTSTASVAFEVAPDPDDKEALARWNALSDDDKENITEEMTDEFGPKILSAMGVKGRVEIAFGGYQGEINPSRVLVVDKNPFEVAGVIGTVFDQKAMVVMTAAPSAGTEPVGMVAIDFPGGTAKSLRELQGKLGTYAEDGWTYHKGKVQLLNFTGKSNVDLATEIDERLGGNYTVGHGTIHSALVGRSDYVSPGNDSGGNAWGERSGQLRNAFAATLGRKIKAKAPSGQVGDKFNPNQPRDPGGEGGGQWVAAGGGDGDIPMDEVSDDVKSTLSPEQLATLAKAAADGNVEEILDAMAPAYAAAPSDTASTLVLQDGNVPEGFFDKRVYNIPVGDPKLGKTYPTNLEGAVRYLMDKGATYAGPGGPGQDRKAIMLIGPPAAGKSTIAESLALQGYAIVDADEAKKLIPGYDGGRGSGFVHEESSSISKMVQSRFARQGTNVIVQTVSTGPSSAIAKVDKLHRLNYKVALVGMQINPDIAAQRMARRYIKTGRFVPAQVVRTAPRVSMETYEALKEYTDGYAKVDSGRAGKPVALESTLKWIKTGKPLQ